MNREKQLKKNNSFFFVCACMNDNWVFVSTIGRDFVFILTHVKLGKLLKNI